jgi:hypothetical protein
MPILSKTINKFVSGTCNLVPNEITPKDSSGSSTNWITKDGHIELAFGRQIIGTTGVAGKNYGEHTAYKADGTVVRFKKANGAIQTLVGTTWTNVITGLTTAADYTFTNYQSLAGAFVYIFGVDGIYKICTANPTSYATLYDSTKNFKGFAFIDKGRSILWGNVKDGSGLRGSWIDNQLAVSGATGVYTAVAAEATTSLTGTLGFKAGGATRTCFGVLITVGAVTFTDDYNGVLIASSGANGTINYMTGAYTVSEVGVGTADYQWENSNLRGVTDFTHSATRLAGEGFVVRQDAFGTKIKTVIPYDGSYFSLKENCAYQFTLDATDLAPVNSIYRTDIGVSTLRSAIGTSLGIVFMNTANPSEPRLMQLKRNPIGDIFDMKPIFPQFKFQDYNYSDVMVDFWDKFVLVGCKYDSDENNKLLLCNNLDNTVDEVSYGIRTATKANGYLYGGDPVSTSTYELFTGFDDIGTVLTNHWDSKGETWGSDALKRVKRKRFKGKISIDQIVAVYESVDDSDFTLIGRILGTGDYVDYTNAYSIGSNYLGALGLGGGSVVSVYGFFMELKPHAGKFRKRVIRFIAEGIGYISIEQFTDFDIWLYPEKLPTKYRLKQNIPLAGTPVDSANPDY